MSESIPPCWAIATLRLLTSKLVDGSHNPPARVDSGLPMLSAKNVHDGQLSFDDARIISSQDFAREHKRSNVTPGDVLLTIVGSIGRTTVVAEDLPPFTLQRSVAVMTPDGIHPRYLSYQLRSPRIQRHLGEKARGTAQKGVYLNTVGELPILVAPQPEQTRIVSKIDELFSEIEEGERALERVQKLVERYRQSVLKAAVTGELTRAWRETRKERVESGDTLLKRILKMRRQHWETTELERLNAKGRKPVNETWKQRYQEPVPPETSELPQLPQGWAWASLDMVADITGGITVDKKRNIEGCKRVPYLRVANVQRGYLDLSEIKEISAPVEQIEELRLVKGDILFNEGGDLDKLGRGWIWEDQLPVCIHQNHVFRARLFLPGPWSRVISWYANVLGKQAFMDMGKQTTNLASISLSKLKTFAVPVMCETEATEIVNRAEDALSVIDKQQDELRSQQSASGSLRRSVLNAAFSGMLVDQDPADSPATSLLNRLDAERSGSDPAGKFSRKKGVAA